jgi:copper chaperone CopZ
MSTGNEKSYTVTGMTCGHCEASVREKVEQVAGVIGIDVDRQTGRLTVRGDGVTDEAIHEAVDEAGYEVVSS